MISKEQRVAVIAMTAAGESVRAIAAKLQISPNTVLKYRADGKDVIDAAQFAEREELARELGLLRMDRIKRHSALVAAIEKELEGRNVADLRTTDLVRLRNNELNAIGRELGKCRALVSEQRVESLTGQVSFVRDYVELDP